MRKIHGFLIEKVCVLTCMSDLRTQDQALVTVNYINYILKTVAQIPNILVTNVWFPSCHVPAGRCSPPVAPVG